jgi:hypothetical protein
MNGGCLTHDFNLIRLIILKTIYQLNKGNQVRIVVQKKEMILKLEI